MTKQRLESKCSGSKIYFPSSVRYWFDPSTFVTKSASSADCCDKSRACETAVGAKGKRFILSQQPGRMVESCLKDHPPFLLKPPVFIKIRRGGIVFYPIIFPLFGMLRFCPFIFLAFVALNFPLCIHGQGETPQCSLAGCPTHGSWAS